MTASIRRVPANERGIILFVTLVLLALLIAVGVGAWVSVQNEFRVSANVTAGTSAFYLADSGVEWAKEQLSNTTSNPPILENRSQTLRSGSFAVVFDTPVRDEPLSARVVVRSTGSLGRSSQTVQAQLTKAYDLTDAAVALRGNGRGVNFSGDFLISGADFDPASGALVSGAPSRLGVSLSSESLTAQVESGLSDLQRSNIIGGSSDGAAIDGSDKLPSPMVARLAADLCNSPGAQVIAMAAPDDISLINQIWGTRAAPEIRCVKGATEAGDSVMIGGNFRGVGILIIQDAELAAVGALYWEGLVIVTGDNIGFRAEGVENKEIFGGLIVNETGTPSGPGPGFFDVRGVIRINFSRSALKNVAGVIPTAVLTRSYASLPFILRQDYWRTVNP